MCLALYREDPGVAAVEAEQVRAIDAGSFGAFAGVALGVAPANARARRLYERLGFRAVGTTIFRRRYAPTAAGTSSPVGIHED